MPDIISDPVPVPIPGSSTQVMPDTELTSLNITLASKTGLSLGQVQAVTGATVSGRTRKQVETDLTAWLATRPKGV